MLFSDLSSVFVCLFFSRFISFTFLIGIKNLKTPHQFKMNLDYFKPVSDSQTKLWIHLGIFIVSQNKYGIFSALLS